MPLGLGEHTTTVNYANTGRIGGIATLVDTVLRLGITALESTGLEFVEETVPIGLVEMRIHHRIIVLDGKCIICFARNWVCHRATNTGTIPIVELGIRGPIDTQRHRLAAKCRHITRLVITRFTVLTFRRSVIDTNRYHGVVRYLAHKRQLDGTLECLQACTELLCIVCIDCRDINSLVGNNRHAVRNVATDKLQRARAANDKVPARILDFRTIGDACWFDPCLIRGTIGPSSRTSLPFGRAISRMVATVVSDIRRRDFFPVERCVTRHVYH